MKNTATAALLAFPILVGVIVGYYIGVYRSSERFYELCQGGTVVVDLPDGHVDLVGCAEIARHIR